MTWVNMQFIIYVEMLNKSMFHEYAKFGGVLMNSD